MDKVTPVNIIGTESPIPVVLEEIKPPDKLVTKHSGQTLAPQTTEEQDTVTAGQRKINLIWERTQSVIALLVIICRLAVNSFMILAIMLLAESDVTSNQLAVISVGLQFINLTAGIVIGFYFSRTNHTKVGGVMENQKGR